MLTRINVPPVSRTALVALLGLSLLYNIARWRQLDTTTPDAAASSAPSVPYLTLVPSRAVSYPWTLLTATFVEQNIFTVILNSATLFYGGKYLERAWGSREFAKFLLLVTVIPNVIVVPIYLLWDSVGRDSQAGLSTASSVTRVCGGVAIQASFLVAFKQLVPEHTVAIFKGLVKARVKHFPALFLLLNSLSGAIFGTDTAALLAWLGFLTSWVYLRFYKRQPDLMGTSTGGLGVKGDASETFAFVCFFPDVMQPPIGFIADRVYSLLVATKICTPFSDEDIASGNQQALERGEAGLPNLFSNNRPHGTRSMGKREEAERRRTLALKALDQRLQAAAATAGRAHSPSHSASNQSAQSQPQPATPTISSAQGMLGETSYTPDHS